MAVNGAAGRETGGHEYGGSWALVRQMWDKKQVRGWTYTPILGGKLPRVGGCMFAHTMITQADPAAIVMPLLLNLESSAPGGPPAGFLFALAPVVLRGNTKVRTIPFAAAALADEALPCLLHLHFFRLRLRLRAMQAGPGCSADCNLEPQPLQLLLVTEGFIGVGTLAMANGIATCAIVKERSHA